MAGLPGQAQQRLLPDQVHKHLSVRMTMTGNFDVEKEYVRGEMQRQLESLIANKVLSPSLKELAIKVGIISVFCYSTGLVPWSQSELNNISKMWSTGYKQTWFKKAARSADAAPMILSYDDAGGIEIQQLKSGLAMCWICMTNVRVFLWRFLSSPCTQASYSKHFSTTDVGLPTSSNA